MVVPEGALLLAEDGRAGRVGGGVVGHRGGQPEVEPGSRRAAFDALTPVGVDLAREVDLPAHGPIVWRCEERRADSSSGTGRGGRRPLDIPDSATLRGTGAC